MTGNGCRRVAEVRVIEVVGKGVAGSEVDGLEEVGSGEETSGVRVLEMVGKGVAGVTGMAGRGVGWRPLSFCLQ